MKFLLKLHEWNCIWNYEQWLLCYSYLKWLTVHIFPHNVRMQYVYCRLIARYFLFPWRDLAEIRTQSTLFHTILWCNQTKWVSSQNFLFSVFLHFLLGYYLSFNLAKTPWRLGNWILRNRILSDYKNNKETKKLSALFGYIFKVKFATTHSFCLIASHMYYIKRVNTTV